MGTDTSTPQTIDEGARGRFETAWTAGQPEPIEHFLPPEDDSHYLVTLEELVHIDLEFAWKSWQEASDVTLVLTPPPLVENYLKRFARLNQPAIVRRLLEKEHLVRCRHGDRPSPTEYCLRFPGLIATRAEVAAWRVPSSGEALTLPDMPDYQLLEILGRGGMGVVYKARQTSLNRLVALKMILAGTHAGLEELARFRTEAEAVARLQHPNVVQIFEVGQHDGRPYLALEFVEGGSLAQHLAGAPQAPGLSAAFLETVARAMHRVHQGGIVHRDLKPANVLLQIADCSDKSAICNLQFAIPKITDFGLAKLLEGPPGLTQSGAVMGTPSYMAPEQARGDSRQVGVPADVYALGAILYELLTGRPPFLAATASETMQQVLTEEPVPPLRVQPKLPRDLATICLKCLHKESNRRYASALDLADDLHRYLAGEPIRARPVGNLERALKWTRRRPAMAALLAGGAGLLLALLLGGLAYNSWLQGEVEREQERTREAERLRAETQAQRDRAEGNFQFARDAVDRMLTRLGTQRLAGIPHLEQERLQALQDARAFYEKFLEQKRTDRSVQRDAALAYCQLGNICVLLGEHPKAALEYERALRLQQQLTAEPNPLPIYWRDLADTYNNRGHLRAATGRVRAAEADYRRALAIRQRLAADPSAPPIDRQELAAAFHNLGNLFADLDRYADAEANFKQALPLLKKLTARDPANSRYRFELARTCNDLGSVLRIVKRRPEAKRFLLQAIRLLERLSAEIPKNPDFRRDLANACNNLGLLHSTIYEDKQAIAQFRKAIDLQRMLADDFAAMPDYHAQLGGTLQNLADLLIEKRQTQEALKLLKEAIAHQLTALKANPREPKYHEFFRFHCESLTDVLAKMKPRARTGWQDYRYAAGILAQSIGLLEQDPQLPPSKRAEMARAYAVQAVTFLREAMRRGFRDTDQLTTDKSLAPLRAYAAFQELLREVKKL